ncbi:MAG: hypothetical protein RBS91_09515 [Sulfurimonadaceae bacterium]|jgi:hypothetical protein|nr:hypothetical protein [Sulfurimonadaceae bacterium]
MKRFYEFSREKKTNVLQALWSFFINPKLWLLFITLYFFTGGYFLYVIAFIFKIDWLYTVATSYVFAIGIANPIIPIIPMTIALTITIYKVIGAKKKR